MSNGCSPAVTVVVVVVFVRSVASSLAVVAVVLGDGGEFEVARKMCESSTRWLLIEYTNMYIVEIIYMQEG